MGGGFTLITVTKETTLHTMSTEEEVIAPVEAVEVAEVAAP